MCGAQLRKRNGTPVSWLCSVESAYSDHLVLLAIKQGLLCLWLDPVGFLG